MYDTLNIALDSLILGNGLLLASFVGFSAISWLQRYFNPPSCPIVVATNYELAEMTEPQFELEHEIVVFNRPTAAWPQSQVKDISDDALYSIDVDDITVESIDRFERTVAAAIAPPVATLTIPVIDCAAAPISLWATDAKFTEIKAACRSCAVQPGRSRETALSRLIERVNEWGWDVA